LRWSQIQGVTSIPFRGTSSEQMGDPCVGEGLAQLRVEPLPAREYQRGGQGSSRTVQPM